MIDNIEKYLNRYSTDDEIINLFETYVNANVSKEDYIEFKEEFDLLDVIMEIKQLIKDDGYDSFGIEKIDLTYSEGMMISIILCSFIDYILIMKYKHNLTKLISFNFQNGKIVKI